MDAFQRVCSFRFPMAAPFRHGPCFRNGKALVLAGAATDPALQAGHLPLPTDLSRCAVSIPTLPRYLRQNDLGTAAVRWASNS